MNQGMGFGERSWVKKKQRRSFEIFARGTYELRKYRKGEDEPYECLRGQNTIEAGGFDIFLNLIAGVDTTGHFDAGSAVRLLSDVDATVRTFIGVDAGPIAGQDTKAEPAATYTWEWHDDSVDTYVFRKIAVWNQDPATGTQFSLHDFGVNQSKPQNENWHYIFDLELYSVDTDFLGNGLLRLLDIFSGNQTTNPLTAVNVRLRPTDGANNELGTADQNADANPTVDLAGNKLSWVWTVVDGDFNGTWAKTKVKHFNGALLQDIRFGGCKTDGSSCGTKGTGEEWEYTYEFSIAQGS